MSHKNTVRSWLDVIRNTLGPISLPYTLILIAPSVKMGWTSFAYATCLVLCYLIAWGTHKIDPAHKMAAHGYVASFVIQAALFVWALVITF